MRVLGSMAAAAVLLLAPAAQAQVVSVGTTNGGAIAQLGAAVSSVVSANSDVQMRPQAMAGTQQYIAGVDLGRIDFGISNIMQYYMAVTGTGLSEGEPHENLRLVATLAPFIQGILVANESDINSVEDLRGRRIPSGYSAAPLFETFWDGFLASEGVERDEVTQVPVVSLPRSWDAFKQGEVDAVIAAAGSAPVREMDASISGGVRYLSLEENEELLEALPRTRLEQVEPREGLDGVPEPANLHVYDTVLFANAEVPDDVVYSVVKALAENAVALKESGPLWADYSADRIAADHKLEYHPGALRYFEEAGLASQ